MKQETGGLGYRKGEVRGGVGKGSGRGEQERGGEEGE